MTRRRQNRNFHFPSLLLFIFLLTKRAKRKKRERESEKERMLFSISFLYLWGRRHTFHFMQCAACLSTCNVKCKKVIDHRREFRVPMLLRTLRRYIYVSFVHSSNWIGWHALIAFIVHTSVCAAVWVVYCIVFVSFSTAPNVFQSASFTSSASLTNRMPMDTIYEYRVLESYTEKESGRNFIHHWVMIAILTVSQFPSLDLTPRNSNSPEKKKKIPLASFSSICLSYFSFLLSFFGWQIHFIHFLCQVRHTCLILLPTISYYTSHTHTHSPKPCEIGDTRNDETSLLSYI